MNATLRLVLAEHPTLVLVLFVSVINTAEIGKGGERCSA